MCSRLPEARADDLEAALKFFLVGTVSSGVIAYGMSFIYGVTGSTALDAIAPALPTAIR
jgi:NADH-quinone oxidoreductase subunit N